MELSLKNIQYLLKLIRVQTTLDNIIKYSDYGSVYHNHILNNELFFLNKVVNQQLSRKEFYFDNINNYHNKINDCFLDIKRKSEIYNFDQIFLEKIQIGNEYQLKIDDIEKYIKIKLDPCFNASALFREVYLKYQNADLRLVYAVGITNSYLDKFKTINFTSLISEVIFTNDVLFNSCIIDKKQFMDLFFQMIYAQNKKNLTRIEKTEKLIKKNKTKFLVYGPAITKYIYHEGIFSLTDFVDKNDISYNTAKKYLKELCDENILKLIKVGKHNAFIYEELFEIWTN